LSGKLKTLYITPGCFDKGGISRYSRYQISALREILGPENITALSLLGPDEESFETPFTIDWYSGTTSFASKMAFTARIAFLAFKQRPQILWTAHVAFSGIVRMVGSLVGAKTVVNEYGLEAWTDIGLDAAWGLRGMGEVVSDCHFTAKWMESAGKRPPGSVHVVWDCVDIDRFTPGPPDPEVLRRYGIPDPDTGVNVLSLGRMNRELSSHKGYDRLIDAFSRALLDLPALRLIFAGKGDLVPVLKARADALGLGGRVFFTGMVHEDDLKHVYRAAHVFSLVSDRGPGRGEGIPLTPLEASACGVPILVGNQDGSQEAVIDGVTGYLLDPFDLESHAGAIVKLASSDDQRQRMGIAGRKRIEFEFSFPGFVEKHRSLIRSWFPEAANPVRG
jgi:phosphatidylinositol alpha-1,6-mannosyltransferase